MIFKNVDAIKQANTEIGHHFFDRDAMAFFSSRVEDSGRVWGGRYFVTSEQCKFRGETFARRYTLRRANRDGSINTVFGQFQEYETLADAISAADKASKIAA